MRRVALALAALLLLLSPASASTAGAAAPPALVRLDAALAVTSAAVDAALLTLGQNSHDVAARADLTAAAADAIAALDAAPPDACSRDWWAVVRSAYLMLGRSVADIEAYDAAGLALDPGAAQLALVDLNITIPHGIALFRWAPTLRAEVQCK